MKSVPKTRQTNLRLQRDRRQSKKKAKPHRMLPIQWLREYRPQPGGILLVGLCTISAVARRGHYFEGTYGRRVWKKLVKAGLLEITEPRTNDDEVWATLGHGITDLVSRNPKSQGNLSRDEIARGVDALRAKVRKWAPRAILFAFKNAAFPALGVRDLAPGAGPSFEGVPTFLLTGPYAKPEAAEEEAVRLAKL